MRKLLGYPALGLTAFLLALPASAQVPPIQPPPGMAPNAAGAPEPATRNNLGLPTNWVQPYHQNGGCIASGHFLLWGDCNADIKADHFGVQSQDASVSTTATLGGSNTVGDQIGWQIGASNSYITVAAGDTSTTILNKLAAALNGGAVTATIGGGGTGSGYTNNDVVSLTGAGITASCPIAPAFKLTVSGGNVTAAVIAGAGGSSVMGGYCQATPSGGPFAVAGGTGSGLTLNVTFANPAIATAMLAITDGNGIGYAATANIQGSNLQFDFPSNGTLLTCASGGTGSGCPGSPTETITLNTANLDNGPFGYMSRLVPGRTPTINDAIGWWRVDGQSTSSSGTDTQYGGLKVRIGTVSSSAPEGIASLEGATNGSKGSLPLLSCLGSLGCWVDDGIGSNPAQSRGTSRGGFAASAFNNVAITKPASSATLTIANGKTLTANKTLTLTAPDDTAVATLPGGAHSLAPLDSPSFTTPNIGDATAASITQSTSVSGQIDTFTTAGANGYIAVGGASRTVLLGAVGSTPFIQAGQAISIQTGGGAPQALLSSEPTSSKTGNYTVLNSDSGQHFDNTGAGGEVDFTLPTYAAGLQYCFTVTAAQILKVIAPASNKIAVGTTNSATAGNVTANAVYSTICLYATTVSNQWAAKSATGTWTVN